MNDKVESSVSTVNRRKIFINGFIIWTLWIIFYAIFFKMQVANQSFIDSIRISAITYYVFALLSILIWVICKRIPFGTLPTPLLIAVHFILSMVFSAAWLFIVYGWWYLQAGARIFEIEDVRASMGWQFLFGMMTYLIIAGVFYTIIYYKQFRQKELREAELKLLTRDAEFKALKMQINPHFLFNSLNSINALVTQNPKQAREMIARLSDLLRMTLENRDKMLVPLHEELDIARVYLEIETIRFRDRLSGQEDIAQDVMDVSFPAMVLQPLLENAVKHGIAGRRGKGLIRLSVHRIGDKIRCEVINTVKEKGPKEKAGVSNGTGLANIRRRLELIYKDDFIFHTDNSRPGEFSVSLTIPMSVHGHD